MAAKMDRRRVRDYYATYAYHGRAVLHGTLLDPSAWITWPDPTRDIYCLCWARKDQVMFTDGATTLRGLLRLSRMRVQ